MRHFSCFVLAALFVSSHFAFGQSVVVPKTNAMKVYVHMMPWFQTSKTLGGSNWGYHWTMNATNPNTFNSSGQRNIASYYYPLTGPYDSTDTNIIEYQMLLMKLSGIDGVIVDWYGAKGSNGDINSLLTASNDIVNSTATYGLQFAACLEDRFATSTSDVTANINYLQSNYFNKSNYIHAGASNAPLMPIFGPVQFTRTSQWNTIMSGTTARPDILPLQYQSQQVGSYANGEFAWVYQDSGTSDHLTLQQNFLSQRAPNLNSAMGVAYPGFNAYYQAAGVGGPTFVIPSNNGQTLSSVLALDSTYASNMNMLQLATWNDYGEGTMFEPTVQAGFTSLMQVQKFTGVSYGLSKLEMVYQLYEERTANAGNSAAQTTLNQASSDLNQLDFIDAATALNQYQNQIWSGAASNNHWSNSANWGGKTVVATNILNFAGTTGLSASNDFAAQTQFNGITFSSGAGAFTLTGNSINLYGDIVNNSANVQKISLNMALEQNVNINATSGDISITGAISDGLYGPAGLTKLGSHILTVSGSNSYSGPTIITAGMLALATALTSSPISVAAGATLQLDPGAAINTATLTLANGSGLDVTDNSITFDTTVAGHGASALLADLKTAYNNGAWDGASISSATITSSLAASSHGITTLGYQITGNNFTIACTLPGDTDLNGAVDSADLTNLINHIGWDDFNYDGVINADDYALLELGATYRTIPPALAPEPASTTLIVITALAALAPRRK